MGAAEEVDAPALDRSYAGITATLNQARLDLTDTLTAHGFDDHRTGALVADAQLVLSELITNAVDASPGEHYRVAATIEPEHVHLCVTNTSTATFPEPDEWNADDVLAASGRGLSIVRALCETVDVQIEGHEITVAVSLRVSTT